MSNAGFDGGRNWFLPRTKSLQRAFGRLLFLLYCLLIVEIVARAGVWIVGIELDDSYGYPEDLFIDHPTRGYSYRPGFNGTFPNARYSDIEISINANGFRDRQFRPAGDKFRIIVIGDSVAFGPGVESEERFGDRLHQRLCGDETCEVLNLAVNGYQAENYEIVLREEIEELRPDLVVIAFCMNDIQHKATATDLAAVRREGIVAQIRQLLSYSTAARISAKLARSLVWSAEDHKTRWIEMATLVWESADRRDALRHTLDRIRTVTTQNGAGIISALLPERSQLEDYERWGRSYELAKGLLREVEIETIDLAGGFLELSREDGLGPLDEIYLNGDNVHFSARGHEIISLLVEPRLADIVRN